MAAKRVSKKNERNRIVNFALDDHTYQIDPERRKVYRRFVEIETSRASQIISMWRAEGASV